MGRQSPGKEIHHPSHSHGNAKEAEEYESPIAEALFDCFLRSQREDDRYRQGKNRDRTEVRNFHYFFFPVATSNAFNTTNRFNNPATIRNVVP